MGSSGRPFWLGSEACWDMDGESPSGHVSARWLKGTKTLPVGETISSGSHFCRCRYGSKASSNRAAQF